MCGFLLVSVHELRAFALFLVGGFWALSVQGKRDECHRARVKRMKMSNLPLRELSNPFPSFSWFGADIGLFDVVVVCGGSLSLAFWGWDAGCPYYMHVLFGQVGTDRRHLLFLLWSLSERFNFQLGRLLEELMICHAKKTKPKRSVCPLELLFHVQRYQILLNALYVGFFESSFEILSLNVFQRESTFQPSLETWGAWWQNNVCFPVEKGRLETTPTCRTVYAHVQMNV